MTPGLHPGPAPGTPTLAPPPNTRRPATVAAEAVRPHAAGGRSVPCHPTSRHAGPGHPPQPRSPPTPRALTCRQHGSKPATGPLAASEVESAPNLPPGPFRASERHLADPDRKSSSRPHRQCGPSGRDDRPVRNPTPRPVTRVTKGVL